MWGGRRKIGKRACPIYCWTESGPEIFTSRHGIRSLLWGQKETPRQTAIFSHWDLVRKGSCFYLYTRHKRGTYNKELLIGKLQRANQGQGDIFLVVSIGSWRGSIASLGGRGEMGWLTSQGLLSPNPKINGRIVHFPIYALTHLHPV